MQCENENQQNAHTAIAQTLAATPGTGSAINADGKDRTGPAYWMASAKRWLITTAMNDLREHADGDLRRFDRMVDGRGVGMSSPSGHHAHILRGLEEPGVDVFFPELRGEYARLLEHIASVSRNAAPPPPEKKIQKASNQNATSPKTISAIARYVNCFSEENYGVLIDTDPGGMVLVHWDEFTPLLLRLGPRLSDFDRRNLGIHQSWVRAPMTGPNGSYTEILPIDTPVTWTCEQLRVAQREGRRAATAAAE